MGVEADMVGQKRNGKEVAKGNEEGCINFESEHGVHIFTERERRKKMRCMFSGLHALLPQLPPKTDKSTIVDEAINYIKTLQQNLQSLEIKRLEKLRGGTSRTISEYEPVTVITSSSSSSPTQYNFAPNNPIIENLNLPATSNQVTFGSCPSDQATCFRTWFSPNVVMNMCGNDAQISVCSAKKPKLLTTMLYLLDKHRLDVVSAHISSDSCRSIYMFHVNAGHYGTTRANCDNWNQEAPMSIEDRFKLAAGEMNLWLGYESF